ncbi:hypothetical protein H632_c117p2 [Helicosporidium sp. ATCC 50920]|nr:hypothetical protein H632_c117p2 [Helicosporidium sp. ATCC 50920]|eukprot:KDD76755.1 hypothetical protein H632_c117p2 [Helicosporidium sp. ATCC 50920]
MTDLEFYGDLLSQPSRSVYLFLECTGIPYTMHSIDLTKRESRTPEYLKINPQGHVPYIVDKGHGMPESGAILMYLADSRKVDDHWFPKDLLARAEVQGVLCWHGSALRAGGASLVFNRVLAPRFGMEGSSEVAERFSLPRVKQALGEMENCFLSNHEYLAAGEISIADLLVVCELEMLQMLDVEDKSPKFDELLADYPRVRAWRSRVRERCGKPFDKAHERMLGTIKHFSAKQ